MINSWQCPYCNHFSILNNDNRIIESFKVGKGNHYNLRLAFKSVTCTNPTCKELTLDAWLYKVQPNSYDDGERREGRDLKKWKLKPQSLAKPLPDYIPKAIINDYEEACVIAALSPKASATLSRRCLQGMIRDFWQVKGKRTLYQEIEAIKDLVDSTVWDSIDAVRTIGNIGAHMEEDINVIIEVDEEEANLLIKLVEILIAEWYINRHERKQRLESVTALKIDKKAQAK